MIIDGVPFDTYVKTKGSAKNEALVAFVEFIEKRLGARFLYDARSIPFGRTDLIEPTQLATLLKERGIIKEWGEVSHYPDEPRIKSWYALCNDPSNHLTGGSTWESDSDALFAALAEALERYIWSTQTDYFRKPRRGTLDGIQKFGACVAPEEIVGFSKEQRAGIPERALRSDAQYLWIQGVSLTQNRSIYIPAQVVSGVARLRSHEGTTEPLVRQSTTNGLATWPTRTGARLAGALEVIERDAYMITWLNQLTLPRISLTSLASRFPSLGKIMATCERYRLKTHVIPLATDAPTHAVAVVMEDMSGNAPRFSIGLKAHRSLRFAVEKAMTEALRARSGPRRYAGEGKKWDVTTPTNEIGHRERLQYWSIPEHATELEFLVRGPETEIKEREWDNDSEEAHLQRIVQWCKDKKYECVSVSLGISAKNPTPLHIEMVVIPQLQPTYLTEQLQEFGGKRWHTVPQELGYASLHKPFAERPHPFS